MPRQAAANQRIRDERREEILKAAANVFARKGLAATKIADIASAAQVSHGLVYHYFQSKEEIFAQLVKRALSGAERVAQEALAVTGTPFDRLKWLTTEMLLGARRSSAYMIVVLQAQTSEAVPSEVREIALRDAPATQAAVRSLLSEGQAAGEIIAGDVNQLATIFLACIAGLTSMKSMDLDDEQVEVETVLSLFRARKSV